MNFMSRIRERARVERTAGFIRRIPRIWPCCLILSAGFAAAGRAQPHAPSPLPSPQFSIDLVSPSAIPGGNPSPDDVLAVEGDGTPPPGVQFDALGLGLGQLGDDLDAMSWLKPTNLHGPTLAPSTFAMLITVDRTTTGAADPLFFNLPFNIRQQARLNQAAGDEYLVLGLFDQDGASATLQQNNVLVENQADIGGVDGASVELVPNVDPFFDATGQSIDALDGTARVGPFVVLFFSLTGGSPSLATLPGPPSGADVFVDSDLAIPGTESMYASFQDLGLFMADELDALEVLDDGDMAFDPTTDQILFSLSAGSPSLPLLGASAADVLTTTASPLGGPPIRIFAVAEDLGLCPTDELSGLDLMESDDVVTLLCLHGVRVNSEGDANGDCIVDPLDVGFVQARFGCMMGTGDSSCLAADVNGDGVVDPLDSGYVLGRLGHHVLASGACCQSNETCEVIAAEDCIRNDGLYRGDGTTCDEAGCDPAPLCEGPLSCCSPHDSPGCDELGCQLQVCTILPTCCGDVWGQQCADIAAIICPGCHDSVP